MVAKGEIDIDSGTEGIEGTTTSEGIYPSGKALQPYLRLRSFLRNIERGMHCQKNTQDSRSVRKMRILKGPDGGC